MKLVVLAALAALLGACATTPTSTAAPASTATPGASALSEAEPQTKSPIELLECDSSPSPVGDFGEGLALEGGGGATPEEALRTFLANAAYVIPRSDYEPIGQSGDRYAYGYRNDGEVKVVIVVSPRFAHLVEAAFAADELRACPEAEFGSDATFADGRRIWTHRETGEILTDIVGPGHCGWESARMLHVAHPDGTVWKQYVRDPADVLHDAGLLDAYAEGIDLPADATDSGYRSPEGYELWFSQADTAAFVVTPDGVERWPRADPPIGCA